MSKAAHEPSPQTERPALEDILCVQRPSALRGRATGLQGKGWPVLGWAGADYTSREVAPWASWRNKVESAVQAGAAREGGTEALHREHTWHPALQGAGQGGQGSVGTERQQSHSRTEWVGGKQRFDLVSHCKATGDCPGWGKLCRVPGRGGQIQLLCKKARWRPC